MRTNKKTLSIIFLALLAGTAAFLFVAGIYKLDFLREQNKGEANINKQDTKNPNTFRTIPRTEDHLFSLGDGHAYFGENAYYNDKLLEGVDGSGLKNLGYGYAKDKAKVFYKGKPLEDIDAETFKQYDFSPSIFADKNQTYYNGEKMTFSEAEALNNFLTKDIGGTDLGNYYRSYKGKVYYWDEGPHAVPSMILIDANLSQFVTFTSRYCTNELYANKFNTCARYGKDNSKVFLGWYEIKGADPSTFVLFGTYYGLGYSKDKNSVFFGYDKLENADPNSFKIINAEYGKDNNRVYYWEVQIMGADPKTFRLLDIKNQLSRDKDNFFWRDEKIEPDEYNKFDIGKYLE